MNKLLPFICALSVWMSGCLLPQNRPSTLTMHVDKNYLPGPERECLQYSRDKWDEQTSGIANIELVYDYDSRSLADEARLIAAHKLVRWTSETPSIVERERAAEEESGEPTIILGQVRVIGGVRGNTGPFPITMGLVMDRLQDPNNCRLAAMHEFGHVLGIGHLTGNAGNIMFPYVLEGRTTCLKKEDLLGFCYSNECGNIQMKPCEDMDPTVTKLIPNDGSSFHGRL